MKNIKQIFALFLIMFSLFGTQFILIGQNLKTTKENIKKLKTRVDNFIKQPNTTQEKKDKATEIQQKIGSLEEKADNLDEKRVKTVDGEDELAKVNFELARLTQDFNPSNPSLSGSPPFQSTPNLLSVNNNSQDLVNEVDKVEETTEPKASWLPDWLKWTLIGLISLFLIGGIITGAVFLRRNKQRERDEITRNFSDLRRRQSDLTREVKDLTEVSKNLSQQMAQHKADISGLKQSSQNAASYAAPPLPVNTFQPPREEPAFPVAVDNYLAKSSSGAIPVKYDYKERMLVQDDAHEGGLLVVRDSGGGSLYLVPSFGFFQTKSDYTNYFERYFTCARPGSGSIWIRQPATVRAINGGWQLANQGELEVR